jgi:hypothetical protein
MGMLDRRKPPKLTAEALEDWLRHARERAANLHYLAISPDPRERARALAEMSTALRDALERVRIVSEQLQLVTAELRARMAPLSDRAPQSEHADRPERLERGDAPPSPPRSSDELWGR